MHTKFAIAQCAGLAARAVQGYPVDLKSGIPPCLQARCWAVLPFLRRKVFVFNQLKNHFWV